MSQSVRQSELFSGPDWQVLYRAMTTINFNASDPGSINRSLVQYLQTNYPEDFSDWIASSEFVAIIDLLSWLAGVLAFKTDINARENFLEAAEARESILRLARFLSYTPRRNFAARGLLKLVEIQTDDDVYDAFDSNLRGQRIIWNNPDDPDWFERFVLILNSAFVPTNPFGVPLKQGSVAGVRTHTYRLNASFGDAPLSFARNVAGVSMPFEAINLDFDESRGFIERNPNLSAALHMLFRTDGNGNASPSTGFFIGFKQGALRRYDINIDYPVENRVIDLSESNINETDVWVQSLNDDDTAAYDWDKVPAIFSDNVTFNALPPGIRNIFSVITRDDDKASLRFADGRFGNAPVGKMRVWYRISNGLSYTIRPQEMDRVEITIPYVNARGVARNLLLAFSLEEPVSNSTPREGDEDIRRRAPQVYAAQNRMVSGEDYNTFPLQSNLARKIKALVRTYSGHSRFIDLNDPTGSYQDVNVFSDDGIFYKERVTSYQEVPITDNRTADELASSFVQVILDQKETANVVHDFLIRMSRVGVIAPPPDLYWIKATDGASFATGSFSLNSQYLTPGASLLMIKGGSSQWVTIQDMADDPTVVPVDGIAGPVVLSEPVETGWKVTAIVPPYASSLVNEMMQAVQRQLNNSLSFTLWYDYAPADGLTFWQVRQAESLSKLPQVDGSAVKLFLGEFLPGSVWRFSALGLRYGFESLKKVRFYFDGKRAIETDTRIVHEDLVRVLRQNQDLGSSLGLGRDFDLALSRNIVQADGYVDPRRMGVIFRDSDEDGYADDPDTYYRIVSPRQENTMLFWARDADGLYDPAYDVWVFETEADRLRDVNASLDQVAFQIDGAVPESFWKMTERGWERQVRQYRFARGRGPNVAQRWVLTGGNLLDPSPKGDTLNFQWKHYAPNTRRVDPSKTNLIDLFVLPNAYDFAVRQWIANGCKATDKPVAPTEYDLRFAFNDYEQFKMFSDDIVWRPVRYKYLFGDTAEAGLRAQFKVVKLPNAALSDGEIKSRVVRAIGEYFNADFWDFGEKFYFTELAAYVHQQLSTSIASFVIVPETADGSFGDVFEAKCRTDELFISTALVSDITIIDSNTPVNLRIR